MKAKKKSDSNGKIMQYVEMVFFLLLFCVFAYIIIKDLTMTPDSSVQANPYKEYSGEYLKERGLELIVIFSSLTLSIICIILSVALRIYYRKKMALEYLGWGILIAVLWNVTNSIFWPLLFRNFSVVSELGEFMLMLLPLPFLFYINGIQSGRYQKLYNVASVLLLVEFVLCTLLHITGLYDLSDMAFLYISCVILSDFMMMLTMIQDVRTGAIKEYPFMAVGLVCIFLACLFRVLGYFYRNGRLDAVILPVGLIILLFLALLNTIHEITNMEGAKQQALAASEAKGRFLANMSHEIRTPINAVLGMDAMILRECAEPHIREYALDIQNAGQSLLSLINDILDLSKIESGKLEILPGEYDFSSLIHDIMNMISMKAEDKGLSVELFIDEKLPSRLFGDDVRIRQILVNLMNNAVKYTEEGSVTLTVSGEIREVPNADGTEKSLIVLTFQVEDTGIGMKEEDIPKLFAEFERIEEKRNRNIEGTGLGMSITTQLLEMMGSKLEVESVYGEGSKFFFRLEQEIVSREPIGNLEERIRKQAEGYTWQVTFTAPEAQILLVDDNTMNRKVFTSLLKETKVQIDEASGGMECLSMVQKKQYDMIFLDHMMPDLDGIETLHRMKNLQDYPCKSTPVVALTANAVTGAKEMYLAEGFFSFLSKPVNPDKLEKMLMENLPESKLIKSKVSGSDSHESQLAKGGMPGKSVPGDTAGALSEGQPQEGSGAVEKLPEIDGIDWEYALLHTKDMELLVSTVKDFAQMMEGEAVALEKLYQMIEALSGEQVHAPELAEALKQYRVKVHSMKSSAAMIGAVPLSGIAKMLEYAARDSKVERIRKVTPTFLEDWRAMKEVLKPFAAELAGNNDADKPDVDFEILKEKLDLLGNAMEDMDIDTADAISEELNGFRYPEAFSPLIESLTLAVANIDAEQAAVEIKKIQAQIKMDQNHN